MCIRDRPASAGVLSGRKPVSRKVAKYAKKVKCILFFNTKALKVFFAFLAPLRETGLIRFCDCRVPRNKLCGSYPQGVQGIELLSLHQLPQTTPQEPGRYPRELVSYPETPQIIAGFWFCFIITTSPISEATQGGFEPRPYHRSETCE